MNTYKAYEDRRLKVWVVKGPGVLARVATYPEAVGICESTLCELGVRTRR